MSEQDEKDLAATALIAEQTQLITEFFISMLSEVKRKTHIIGLPIFVSLLGTAFVEARDMVQKESNVEKKVFLAASLASRLLMTGEVVMEMGAPPKLENTDVISQQYHPSPDGSK